MPHSITDLINRHKLLVGGLLLILLYAGFISNLSTHPPGFFVDESCMAYNGYLIAKTGVSESGQRFPLYVQCYTQGYAQWMSPAHFYVLALMYLVVPPSILSARILAATIVFFATLLMGVIAFRITRRQIIGVIVAVSAMVTPWLFEISRLVLENYFLIFSIVLFLFFLHNAYQREKWKISDNILIAMSLAFITYSYATGRVLGPLFGFGLLFFAVNRRMLFDVIKTWILYSLTMIPFLIVYFTNPTAISGRFVSATNMSKDKSIIENAWTVISAYLSDMGPSFLLLDGDNLLRHHIGGIGEFLVGTFALAMIGMVVIVLKRRGDPWWRFMLFGTFVCLLPGSVTYERSHSLRDMGLPVFLILLTVPAISWLLEKPEENALTPIGVGSVHAVTKRPSGGILERVSSFRFSRRGLLYCLLVVTAIQAVIFQIDYFKKGDERGPEFDAGYPVVLKAALSDGSRPIYLEDGAIPAYIHALWYGTIMGVDPSNFVHLSDKQSPPYGALVISAKESCTDCEVVIQEGTFELYRSLKQGTSSAELSIGDGPGQFSKPQGLSVSADGSRFVADTENSRIEKFDADGQFLSQFGTTGIETGELNRPHGIAADKSGNIFVTDSSRHRLLKFNPEGQFVQEWMGPEVGFYGPRDIAFAPDGRLYIVDQGRTRIVVLDPSTGSFNEWGTSGSEEGQFSGPTGIAVSDNLVFVADTGNERIQVFDLDGKFIFQWSVPQWEKHDLHFPDIAVDKLGKRVFVTNGPKNEVLVFTTEGELIESIEPEPPNSLDNPSSIVFLPGKKADRLLVLNTSGSDPDSSNPGIAEIDLNNLIKEKPSETAPGKK